LRCPDRLRADRGSIGGIEVLPFGILIFILGGLVALNAWSVLDAKIAVSAGVREGARAVAEAPPGADAQSVAELAARTAIAAHGRGSLVGTVQVAGSVTRCEVVAVTAEFVVPTQLRGFGPFTVRSTASELVDPLRSGLDGEAPCVAG
jgi:hypothetical protein